jgi:hypothetical protein
LSQRPPWRCSVCNVTCTSRETLTGHASGVKHKRKVRHRLPVGGGGPAVCHRGGTSPFTLHPSPFTLHPSPFTLHPAHPSRAALGCRERGPGAVEGDGVPVPLMRSVLLATV